MKSIEQIQQWADWASNHDAAEQPILEMMHTLLSEVDRLKLAAVQLNEVAAKHQNKAEAAESLLVERDRYKAALERIADPEDNAEPQWLAEDALAEAVRG